MIRKIWYLLWILAGCVACNDDGNAGFGVPVEFRKISFDPVPGGAVMRYRLPDDLNIFGVRARYNDAYGRQLVKEGTYLTDTLLLNGFTEARTDQPVQLTFLNSNLEESEPVEMTFNTQAAATVTLFDNLVVNSFWGGFSVAYTSPKTVEGTVHIFYIGTNPATQELDSILVGSYPIMEGGDTLNFVLKQVVPQLDVVIRTDDFDGNRVKTKVYTGIPALVMEMLPPEQFDFSFTGEIVENKDRAVGLEYLFNGRKKGADYRGFYMTGDKGSDGYRKYGTFVAGPNAFGKRFIFDFRTPKVPAVLNADAFLYHGYYYPVVPGVVFPGDEFDKFGAEIWSSCYTSRLPCQLKVYGTNEDPWTVDLGKCTLLYSLDDSPLFDNFYANAWCRFSDYYYGPVDRDNAFKDKSDADFEAADPITLEMKCNYTGEAFRYVFFEVYDTYTSTRWDDQYPTGYEENAREYITFDEIEVFVQKTE